MTDAKLQRRYDEIRTGGAQCVAHLNLTNAHSRVDRSLLEPRIARHSGGPKRGNRKDKPDCFFSVTGLEDEFPTLLDAVTACQKLDQDKEDAAWEAAAPKRAENP